MVKRRTKQVFLLFQLIRRSLRTDLKNWKVSQLRTQTIAWALEWDTFFGIPSNHTTNQSPTKDSINKLQAWLQCSHCHSMCCVHQQRQHKITTTTQTKHRCITSTNGKDELLDYIFVRPADGALAGSKRRRRPLPDPAISTKPRPGDLARKNPVWRSRTF